MSSSRRPTAVFAAVVASLLAGTLALPTGAAASCGAVCTLADDTVAPTVTAPELALVTSQVLLGPGALGQITWTAVDDQPGPVTNELEISIDDAPYVNAGYVPTLTSVLHPFFTGRTYQFRVRASDAAGNVSDWAEGRRVSAKLLQQMSSAASYSSGWTTDRGSSFSGGSVKFAKGKGAWVKFKTTLRSAAFITTLGPKRGKAKIYVNGNLVATIDLAAASNTYRAQAWSRTWSTTKERTIKIVVVGTSGRPRIDADALAILR